MSVRRVRALFTAYGVIVILAGVFCLGIAVVDSFGVGCGYDAMADGSHVDLGCSANGLEWSLVLAGLGLIAGGVGGIFLARWVTRVPLPSGEGGARPRSGREGEGLR